jgi:hypothetical protein
MKKCLEVRETPEGYKRRRYQDQDGTRHTTIEIPLELWQELNADAQTMNERRERAWQLRAMGLKTGQIAERLGVQYRSVCRYLSTKHRVIPSIKDKSAA